MDLLILDTNSFLRFLLNDIPEQAEEASKLFSRAKAKELKIFIPQIVIFEIEFALNKYYKFPKTDVIDKLGIILATTYLIIQDVNIFNESITLFKSKNIDFVDCFLTCSAKQRNATLFTFDKDLKMIQG